MEKLNFKFKKKNIFYILKKNLNYKMAFSRRLRYHSWSWDIALLKIHLDVFTE